MDAGKMQRHRSTGVLRRRARDREHPCLALLAQALREVRLGLESAHRSAELFQMKRLREQRRIVWQPTSTKKRVATG